MIDSIFKRLSPNTLEALQRPETTAELSSEVNVDELTQALSSVKGEIEVAHASLQKIYEEANYVYVRLDHMEHSMSGKGKSADGKDKDDEGGSSSEGGQSGGSVVVEKHLFVGDGRSEEKLSKIQEAKALTQDLLSSIEGLSAKVKHTSTATNTPRPRM